MFRYVLSGSGCLAFLVVVACSSDGDEGAEVTDAGTSGPTTGMTGMTGMTSSSSTTTSAGSSSTTASAASSSPNTSASTAAATTTTGQPTASDSGGAGGSGPTTGGFGMFGAGGMGASSTNEGTTATASASTGGGGGDCEPAVDCEPEVLPSTGDFHEDCVNRVNQFRVDCWCLPALERWTEGEACADEHAEYDAGQDEAHAGFSDGICENGGNGQNECPGWGSEPQIIEGCLQMMYDEGPPPSEQCNGQCFQDHGHFINMTNENYSRVACGFYTTPGGDVWSVQNFR